MKAPVVYKYLPPELADQLRHLGLTVRRPVEGPMQGLHKSPHFGSSVEFAEYREYSPGDPPNLIDWAVFARSDRYMIRRFREETNLRAHILLDTSESLAYREFGRLSKMDYASYLAAALMYILISQGDSVGLLTFESRLGATFEPAGSLEGLRPLLLGLEDIRPAGRSHIEHAVHEVAGLLRSRSLVILISDLLEKPEDIVRGIWHLHHDGHDVLVLHVMDGGEMSLAIEGSAELRELETGARMVVEVDELREAYGREIHRYLEELRLGCAGCMATYHFVDTRAPVEETLMRIAHA